jgi:hypothetical protein
VFSEAAESKQGRGKSRRADRGSLGCSGGRSTIRPDTFGQPRPPVVGYM